MIYGSDYAYQLISLGKLKDVTAFLAEPNSV